MRTLTIIFISLLLTGCYTQIAVKDMIKDTEHYKVPYQATADRGLVYVVRPSSFYGIFKYNVFLDGKEGTAKIGYNRGYQYIYFYVEPGKHTVISTAENTSEINFDIKAGETIYLIQDGSFGFLFGRNSIYKLNPVEGQYYVKHTGLGTIIPNQH